MLSPLVVNIIAALIAVLVIVLLFRVASKWFTGGGGDTADGSPVEVPVADLPERSPLEPGRSVDVAAAADAAALNNTPPTEPVGRSADETASPRYEASYRVAPVPDVAAIWSDRKLFGSAHDRGRANDLPHVGSDDVPTASDDDYVFGASLTPAFASLLPESDERKKAVKQELVNAGYYEPHAWHNLAAIRYFGIMLMVVLFGGLLLILPERLEMVAIVGLVLGPVLAWSLPRLMVRGKATDRISEIERGMPDMLDMLNMCVSQGLTVQQSLARISREMYTAYPALAQELAIVVEQSRVGTLEQALHNFEDRIDVPEVHSFVALLTQTERMGTSVSTALVDYSDGMRESLRQRADTKANQATFKLLFPTVLCLMPAVYLFLLGPALIELTNFIDNGGLDAVSRGGQSVQQFQTR